jgi:hypothetical protein
MPRSTPAIGCLEWCTTLGKNYDHAHNARVEDDLYNQRSVYETVNSGIEHLVLRRRSSAFRVPSARSLSPRQSTTSNKPSHSERRRYLRFNSAVV